MPGKKFKFSLENVLKLRRHETEQARQALGLAMQDVQRQEARRAQAAERLQELARQTATLAGATDPFALRQYDGFRRDAYRAFQEAGKVLERYRQKEAKARAELLQRRRDEEALQALHDQQKVEHERAQEAAEMEFLDEQAIAGYNRKKQGH